ncbi:MAG: hypothetical protein WD096_12165 [Actinomycetota bacterium]
MNDTDVTRSITPLLGAAMAIFVFTVVIGILNGTDLLDPEHGLLLAHVHSGTLGWITLSIFAAGSWIFGAPLPRMLRDGAVAAVVFYVAMFWLDSEPLRPVAGTLMLLAIVWFAVWVFQQRAGQMLTVPRLSILLASVNLVIGGVLGVLLGLQLAGTIDLGEGIAGAHPAMMVVGYLILAGVAVNEQLLGGPGTQGLPRAGAIQAWLFFGAGIALAIGVLFDILPLLGLNLLGEVVGVAIVLWRHRGAIAGAGWPVASERLHAAMSLLFAIPALGLLAYLIVRYSEDIEAAPQGLFLALDHATFVGLLTNAILGLVLFVTMAKRDLWAWADRLVFWGMNLGLATFLVGLIAEESVIKRIGTPVMGTSILLGLLTAATRLRSGSVTSAA